METYPIPMTPGPVRVPEAIRDAHRTDYGVPGMEPEFFALYERCEAALGTLLGTRGRVAILTGEGMLALWAALKSCLKPGDRVLSVATGVFGYGIAEMARSIGADVRTIGLGYDETIGEACLREVETALKIGDYRMITAVHCETPSGTLNPLAGLGVLKKKYGVPLFYADVVSSMGGAPVLADEWGIDLALGGSQKCLSMPPSLSFVSVSDAAWARIEAVGYVGYDALLPFRDAVANRRFPYTPYWHGLAALAAAADSLLAEGLEAAFERHRRTADRCREGLAALGVSRFPRPEAVSSPTVTASRVPEGWEWPAFDRRLREKGLAVGGSHGPMAGKVFRMGHMGSQADIGLVDRALGVLKTVLRDGP